jgi:hypothetical protein
MRRLVVAALSWAAVLAGVGATIVGAFYAGYSHEEAAFFTPGEKMAQFFMALAGLGVAVFAAREQTRLPHPGRAAGLATGALVLLLGWWLMIWTWALEHRLTL